MITILAIGKKHEDWIRAGIERYTSRLTPPFDIVWTLLPHSSLQNGAARREESDRIHKRIPVGSFVILLDERGSKLDSPAFSSLLQTRFNQSPVTIIIGGAYGVTDEIHQNANLILALSGMVFPHQLVRLILVEQIYRAQMINQGSKYHHV